MDGQDDDVAVGHAEVHRDKLREEIALAKMKLTHATTEEIDVEGILAFAEHALPHACAIWSNATSVKDRIRIQWAFFPTGLTWNEPCKTAVSCSGDSRG